MSDSVLSKLSWAEWSLVRIGQCVLYSARSLLYIAVLALILQTIKYLQTGVWPDWSVFNVHSDVFPTPFMDWLLYPQNWFGLHKIVSWFVLNCHISLFTLLTAGVWYLVGMLVLTHLYDAVEGDRD